MSLRSQQIILRYRNLVSSRASQEHDLEEQNRTAQQEIDSQFERLTTEAASLRDRLVLEAKNKRDEYRKEAAEIIRKAELDAKLNDIVAQRIQYETEGRCENCEKRMNILRRLFRHKSCTGCMISGFGHFGAGFCNSGAHERYCQLASAFWLSMGIFRPAIGLIERSGS